MPYAIHLEDVLDLAILWAPIGGPPPERIRSEFGIDVAEYRRHLATAIRIQQQRSADHSDISIEQLYAPSVLTTLAEELRRD